MHFDVLFFSKNGKLAKKKKTPTHHLQVFIVHSLNSCLTAVPWSSFRKNNITLTRSTFQAFSLPEMVLEQDLKSSSSGSAFTCSNYNALCANSETMLLEPTMKSTSLVTDSLMLPKNPMFS